MPRFGMLTQRELRQHVGQVLMAGFPGPEISAELRALVRAFDIGGLVLFARNVVEPAQVAELSRELRELGKTLPAWVGVDQEGGRVARLKDGFTLWPPAVTLGRADDEGLTRRFATALARELDAVGITMDFVPVLDVLSNAKNPAIGDRALADEPERVARHGAAIIQALQDVGMAACGKHFPGHGDTSVDSHLDLPLVEHPPDRLRAVEWVPFRAAIARGVPALMTAHLLVPALDDERPATLSRRIVFEALREELGFTGVIFSDDLDMRAIADRYGPGDTAVHALAAGVDGLLFCNSSYDRLAAALEGIIRAVEEETLPIARVADAMTRHRRMKERFLLEPAEVRASARRSDLAQVLASAEHQAIADEMGKYV
jgi:beta-N-acetylhexosaminidase